MPAKDIYHDAIKNALIKDGWRVTADPYPLEYEDIELYPDLAIEKIDSDAKKQRKLIIEIKSFISASLFKDFELALGQYIIYRDLIKFSQSEYQEIYLAIKSTIYDTFFQRKSVQALIHVNSVSVVTIDVDQEEVVQWIN
jgi:hypothetical protein